MEIVMAQWPFQATSCRKDALINAVFQLVFGVYLALEKHYKKQSNLHG
jgi:hypothetical protein